MRLLHSHDRVVRRARLPRRARNVLGIRVPRFTGPAGSVPSGCGATLHGHRCQRALAHRGMHVVEVGDVRLRWDDRTPPTDGWVLDAFDS
ncbi:hypothetical protein [Curtobacterium sp. MCSS17_015]|uniref:hypothetical protein n=1 Tax=Curtobacterium sp. MCSS17_015 TaxID=2175666 RepID=UPI0011B70DBC|nr:hypothetical protein [Curtobacterium sp. MCSS17_015]WIB26885.1 hypothetical protein DEJ18_01975 [Curtobacterium sp. MCSS17_015]